MMRTVRGVRRLVPQTKNQAIKTVAFFYAVTSVVHVALLSFLGITEPLLLGWAFFLWPTMISFDDVLLIAYCLGFIATLVYVWMRVAPAAPTDG